LRVDGSRLFTPPWGLAGGQAGGCGDFKFSEGVSLAGGGSAVLHPGDTVEVVTPGAGGYGPPAARDSDLVARDLADHRVLWPPQR
jgi:N-methylhydantoinase B